MNKMNDGGTYKVYVLIERFFFFFNRIGKEDSLRVLQFGAIVGEKKTRSRNILDISYIMRLYISTEYRMSRL